VNPLLRGSAAHVFVDDLDAPTLTAEDEHHLRRVLRVGAGEMITVSDGRGRWAGAQLAVDALVVTDAVHAEPPPAPVRVGAAIPKGERCEWMVQKLTEVGTTEIVLVQSARSVVRWDRARALRHIERLSRVARQAAMQSRRVWLPAIVGPCAVAEVLGGGAVVADPAGEPLSRRPSAVIVGPEGGFTDGEVGAAPRVTLGAHVLRVETAAVVAAVLIGTLPPGIDGR
jgi:16S rRNA (uracil1498-N3)-methyltransferase